MEDVVRFLDRESADTLSGEMGACDAALRTEGKATVGDGWAGKDGARADVDGGGCLGVVDTASFLEEDGWG